VPELRALPGTDPTVAQYVLSQDGTRALLDKAVDLFDFALPRCEREGKSYLTIAIGCTGGRHRSVVLAEEIAAALRRKLGVKIGVLHRDVERDRADRRPDAHPDSGGTEIELKGLLSAPPPRDLSPPSSPGTLPAAADGGASATAGADSRPGR